MKLHGSLLVIVCCLVVEVCNLSLKEYIIYAGLDPEVRIFALAFEGVLFMLYPLVGHLTDVYLTRYRSLKWSFGILLITTSSLLIYFITDTISGIRKIEIIHHSQVDIPFYCTFSILLFVGLAFFQANAIQFGLDQLLEAPTPKLIAFIHWYYWAQNVGRLVLMYTLGIGLLIVHGFETKEALSDALNGTKDNILYMTVCITVVSIVAAVFVKFFTERKHLYVQQAGLNPFKNIYNVIKYSWKHKVPEHRSAFTYR